MPGLPSNGTRLLASMIGSWALFPLLVWGQVDWHLLQSSASGAHAAVRPAGTRVPAPSPSRGVTKEGLSKFTQRQN